MKQLAMVVKSEGLFAWLRSSLSPARCHSPDRSLELQRRAAVVLAWPGKAYVLETVVVDLAFVAGHSWIGAD